MKLIILSLLIGLTVSVLAQEVSDNFKGEYCIQSVHKYRGGLTSEKEAKAFVGSKVLISEKLFISLAQEITNPIYKLSKERVVTEEGEVRELDSIFHGLFTDRKAIVKINIFENSEEKYPYTSLELFYDGRMFELYDGYVF